MVAFVAPLPGSMRPVSAPTCRNDQFDGKPRDAGSPLITTRRPPHPDSPMFRPSPPNPTASRGTSAKCYPHMGGGGGGLRGWTACLGVDLHAGGPCNGMFLPPKDLVQRSSGLGKMPTHTGVFPGPQHWSLFSFHTELFGMRGAMS